jgi:tripartite-type tricarboxylate transporter receptor subunit TctC
MNRTLLIDPRVVAGVSAALWLLVPQAATAQTAQTFPSRPVRMILSYPPGGATDALGRLVGKALSETWGQTVIADNRPGASGNIGTSLCTRSPADGYTMCVVSIAQSTSSRLSSNAGFDSLKDFTHVGLIATMPMLLLVHPSLPVKNVRELIALAKNNPGSLSYASSGGGAGPHLATELFKQMAGVDILSVVYRGAGAQLTDQLAGRVEVAFGPAVGFVPFVKNGKLRAIAVSTTDRLPTLANVPTIAESGLKNYEASSWQGLSMPAGVPRDIVSRVSTDLLQALKTPAMRERILEMGGLAANMTADQFSAFFQAESDKWFRVAKEAKVVTD